MATAQELIDKAKEIPLSKALKQEQEKKAKANSYSQAAEVLKDYRRQKQYEETLKRIQYEEAKKQYEQSKTGKFGSAISKVSRTIGTKGGVTNFFYGGQIAPKVSMPGRTKGYGKRGRPRGTLNPLYAKYGGVYGYRKYISHQNALAKLRARQAATLSPEQQYALQQLRQQRAAQYANPERQAIPNTYGLVDMNSIFKEIDDAANEVS